MGLHSELVAGHDDIIASMVRDHFKNQETKFLPQT